MGLIDGPGPPVWADTPTLQHPPQSELPAQRSSRLDKKERSTHSTPPQAQLATSDVEAGAKLRECRGGETLGEDVDELGDSRNMENPSISDSNLVTNKVQVDLHILHPLMLNRVCGEVHGADVVAVDESALGERTVKLSQELSETGCFRHTVSDSPVLHLCTGAGDNRLPLGRPGDKVATEENGIAGSATTSVRTPRPVSVGVDDELNGGRRVKEQAVVDSATDVSEKALQSSEM